MKIRTQNQSSLKYSYDTKGLQVRYKLKRLLAFIMGFFSITAVASADPKTAYQEALEGKAVIIDVREKDELSSGMIKNAKWFSLSRIKNDKEWKGDFDKLTANKKIYLYCRSGNRSGQVKDVLQTFKTESTNIGGYQELSKVLPTVIPEKK